eukprot:5858047-Prymnesium_polylepis.1
MAPFVARPTVTPSLFETIACARRAHALVRETNSFLDHGRCEPASQRERAQRRRPEVLQEELASMPPYR